MTLSTMFRFWKWLIFILLLAANFLIADRQTKVGTILLESRHAHFRGIISAVKKHLSLHLSLSNIALEDAHVLFIKDFYPHFVAQAVNYLYLNGVTIVIGPPDEDIGSIVQSICVEMKLYYLSYYLDPVPSVNPFVFRLFPIEEYAEMIRMLFNSWPWNKFSIVYSEAFSLRTAHYFIDTTTADVYFVEIPRFNESHNSYIASGKNLKHFCNEQKCWRLRNRAILDLNKAETYYFLNSALMLGMISADNWFFLVSLDNVIHGMEQYSHNTMRLSTAGQFNENNFSRDQNIARLLRTYEVEKSTAYDATSEVNHIVHFHDAILSIQLIVSMIKRSEKPIKRVSGITGKLSFNNISQVREDATFNILEMGVNGKQTGIWKSESQLSQKMFSMADKDKPNTHETMMEQTKTQRILNVVSIEESPYVMRKLLSNGRDFIYEGFCIDLLNRLSQDLHFEYRLEILPEGKYGEPVNGTKEWDGLIGKILNNKSDAAVAPITMTAGRLEVVDFTDPFLQLGISMLMRIPGDHKASSSLLSFLWPLNPKVWMYWAFVTVGSLFTVVAIAVLSPSESSRKFNFVNSVWYLICILLRAGSGYNCRSISNRLVSSAWWAFTLILIAQYTANFAAVLTVDRKSLPFNSFEELGNQTEYEFGTIQGGSTMHFFMFSRLDIFKKLWMRMKNMSQSVFVETNQEGVKKVLAEKYVFLMESASLEYQLTQHCNLTKVGNVVLGSNGYSIALPKGSLWRERLSRQILDYNEKGIMMMLKRKWWKKTPQIEECEEKAVETRKSLDMDKVSGIFALLATGLVMALIVAAAERILLRFKETQSRELFCK